MRENEPIRFEQITSPDEILKFPKKERKEALRIFKESLATRLQAIKEVAGTIMSALEAGATDDEVYSLLEKAMVAHQFDRTTRDVGFDMVDDLLERRRKLEPFIGIDGTELYEKTFGMKPTGKVELQHFPDSIVFTLDAVDTETVFSGNYLNKRHSKGVSYFALGYAGFHMPRSSYIYLNDLRGAVIVALRGPSDHDLTINHERRHAIQSIISPETEVRSSWTIRSREDFTECIPMLVKYQGEFESEAQREVTAFIASSTAPIDAERIAKSILDEDSYDYVQDFVDSTSLSDFTDIFDLCGNDELIAERDRLIERYIYQPYRRHVVEGIVLIKEMIEKRGFDQESLLTLLDLFPLRDWKKISQLLQQPGEASSLPDVSGKDTMLEYMYYEGMAQTFMDPRELKRAGLVDLGEPGELGGDSSVTNWERAFFDERVEDIIDQVLQNGRSRHTMMVSFRESVMKNA